MYPLIGNVLYAQKVFFTHISVLTQWNRNVDKIYYLYSLAKQADITKTTWNVSQQHVFRCGRFPFKKFEKWRYWHFCLWTDHIRKQHMGKFINRREVKAAYTESLLRDSASHWFWSLLTVDTRLNLVLVKLCTWVSYSTNVRMYLSTDLRSLGVGGSADQMPVGARFSSLLQTGPGSHPASYTMGSRSLSRG
jgi:hypothetical protein